MLIQGSPWWTLPGAAPLYATQADPSYRNHGRRIALIAQLLGTPLLPWQFYVACVATEHHPDGTYRYRTVVVTVPRQAGKTTLMRAIGVDRALSRGDTGVFYTAQTGKDARERWEDLVKAINGSPLSEVCVIRRAAGKERVVFANGSTFQCFAPGPKSLHGYTPPLVMLDEVFAHSQEDGDALMGAIGPAQSTIPHRQLWLVSTKGTAESTFLDGKIQDGRDEKPSVALFEWAAGPDVKDVYDPAVWPTFHPAMHPRPGGLSPLATVEAIAEQAEALPRSEFERAYANRPTRTASHLIPAEVWDALANDEQRSPNGVGPRDVAYVFDVMEDRDHAAITAVWVDGDRTQARVVKSGRGDAWVVDVVRQLHAAGWRNFACTDDGPARELADVLARGDRARDVPAVQVRRLTNRQFADAWGWFMRGVAYRTLQHDGSEALQVAVANIATRPMADAAAPSRRHSAGDITPAVGAMVGGWVLENPANDTGPLEFQLGAA